MVRKAIKFKQGNNETVICLDSVIGYETLGKSNQHFKLIFSSGAKSDQFSITPKILRTLENNFNSNFK